MTPELYTDRVEKSYRRSCINLSVCRLPELLNSAGKGVQGLLEVRGNHLALKLLGKSEGYLTYEE